MCSEKELAFIDEWMGPSRFNGMRAMLAIGVPEAGARVRASEWLNRPHIQAEITLRREERRRAMEATAERLLEEQLSVALASIGDVMEWDESRARFKPKDTLSAEQIAAIAEIAFIPGEFGDRMSVKMHSKLEAIAAIQKQLGVTFQERRRGMGGEEGENAGITIVVEGGPTGLEVTVKSAAA